MHIIKLGGSLARDPRLPGWLAFLASQPATHPLVIVPGGGRFADAARNAQTCWGLDDVAAHNMAVLGMAQYAHLLHGLCPALRLADTYAGLRAGAVQGRHGVWVPTGLQRTRAGPLTNWDTTSDSLAAYLARTLSAQRLTLLKACEVPREASFAELAAAGIMDTAFPAQAAACEALGMAVAVVSLAQGDGMAALRAAV